MSSAEGKVYSWGSNGYGELGLDVQGPTILEPHEIKAFPYSVKHISAGEHISAAITG